MPISPYLKNLRARVGHDLLILPSVAAIVLNDEGHILFQKQSQDNTWSLPAGFIEPGETPSQAIVREVAEETGLTVDCESVLGVFAGKDFTWTYPNGDVVQYTVIVFLCKILGGELDAVDGESKELSFLPASSRPALALPYPEEIFFNFGKQSQSVLFN